MSNAIAEMAENHIHNVEEKRRGSTLDFFNKKSEAVSPRPKNKTNIPTLRNVYTNTHSKELLK